MIQICFHKAETLTAHVEVVCRHSIISAQRHMAQCVGQISAVFGGNVGCLTSLVINSDCFVESVNLSRLGIFAAALLNNFWENTVVMAPQREPTTTQYEIHKQDPSNKTKPSKMQPSCACTAEKHTVCKACL